MNQQSIITLTRYILAVCMCFGLSTAVYANLIDSLTTKERVLKFLSTDFGKDQIFFVNGHFDITQAKKYDAYLSEESKRTVDTYYVTDPVTGDFVTSLMPHKFDSTCHCCGVNSQYSENHAAFDDLVKITENYRFKFYKVDIDKNGRTDLVVDAGIVMVVMDMGGRFEGYTFIHDPIYEEKNDSLHFTNFVSLPDSSTALVFTYLLCENNRLGRLNKTDTIVYKYHGFMKYNPRFTQANISKILYHYEIAGYIGVCDHYNCMELNVDGRCFLQYGRDKTVFSGTVDKKTINDLWNQITYIDVKSKKDNYIVWIDHTSAATFVVYFDDGSVKQIHTWGCAPISLAYLSKRVSDISKAVHWETAEQNAGFNCPISFPVAFDYDNIDFCSCSTIDAD